MPYWHVYINPGLKAGAAPGTTAGVELILERSKWSFGLTFLIPGLA